MDCGAVANPPDELSRREPHHIVTRAKRRLTGDGSPYRRIRANVKIARAIGVK